MSSGKADATASTPLTRHHGSWHYYLLKMLDQHASVEDVLQDVWLDVWRAYPA